MFSDLKKGFQVHTLDTNTVPKYELGKVVAVSEPRYQKIRWRICFHAWSFGRCNKIRF